ncbi:MAG: OmpA family protein, partial [Bacteroidota bacterium]|nr:OmpA family protein [Bacteroidota bacterium]
MCKPICAQKKAGAIDLVHLGNQYFKNEQFYKAVEFYEKANVIDPQSGYINFHLGECYRMLFNYEKAEAFYKNAAQLDKKNYPFALYYYPLMQKLNGNFNAAILNFNIFISFLEQQNGLKGEEKAFYYKKSKIERDGCMLAIDKLNNPIGNFKFSNLLSPVNSKLNDYAPAIYENDSSLVFTSGRSGSKGMKIDNRFGEYFSDIYHLELNGGIWQNSKNDQFALINTEYSDGAGSFNKNKDKYYFTSCHEGGAFCKIYVSKIVDGKWQTPTLLNDNINLKGFESKQPALSSGGDTLIFVSNRPGGFGLNDLWMSIASGEDVWGKAINLGKNINTPYNEISPFFYWDEKILFFASDGHIGFGGLDIFMAQGSSFFEANINNLGVPFNSNSDDAYIVLGEKKGFLSSNRSGGEGKFDIYSFNVTAHEVVIAELDQQQNINKDEMIKSRVKKLNQSNIYAIKDEDKFYYQNLHSSYKIFVDKIVAAKIEALKSLSDPKLNKEEEEYYNNLSIKEKAQIEKFVKILWANNRANIQDAISNMDDNSPILLNSSLMISGKLVRISDGTAAPAINIPLLDHEGKVAKITSTNEDGSFKYLNLPVSKKFKILADNVQTKLTQNVEFKVEALKIEVILKEIISINKENIYFENNSYAIRSEAAKVLDELTEFYKNHKQIQIEIFAFTDNIGSDMYNEILSQMRGQATIEYLVAKGVDRIALVISANGRRKPFASNDDEIGRQLNRRVEFSINGDLT